MIRIELILATSLLLTAACGDSAWPQEIQRGEMAGYLIIPNKQVAKSYDAGFSMYVAAWPLLQKYPGKRFQSGLPGTWMFAQPPGEKVKNLYSDIEGGLGWWRDTEYATETPKFIMGGVAPNFKEWANGPGAGKNRDWSQSAGKYGVAQLSPWLLWPPDGLNLKQGMQGEWLGYGYLPLPLATAKPTTAGQPVPTGNQCWTLFLSAENFKGPVAFFTPYFWSRWQIDEPSFKGQLLDTRPSDPNRALQMETQHVPSAQATAANGVRYAKISPVQFPCDQNGRSTLVHQVTSYNRAALWNAVEAWFAGGPACNGLVQPSEAAIHEFKDGGYATWQIYPDGTKKEDKLNVAWNAFATPQVESPDQYGYRWDERWVTRTVGNQPSLVTLPEYYRLEEQNDKKLKWVPIAAAEVPQETGLAEVRFEPPAARIPKTYETPSELDSCWKTPGPKAGPFQVNLGDGSRLTYYWYRFADQPAMLNADMTDDEREAMQVRVEKLHAEWHKDRTYLPPPRTGALASLDPALLATPPQGLEVGYVPIVTRQEPIPFAP